MCRNYSGYMLFPNADIYDADSDIRRVTSADAAAVAAACSANPWCSGWNTQGWLKHSFTTYYEATGVCAYWKPAPSLDITGKVLLAVSEWCLYPCTSAITRVGYCSRSPQARYLKSRTA